MWDRAFVGPDANSRETASELTGIVTCLSGVQKSVGVGKHPHIW